MRLLKNRRAWMAWMREEGMARTEWLTPRCEVKWPWPKRIHYEHPEPEVYPAYAYTTAPDWENQQETPAYLAAADLSVMLADLEGLSK